MRNDLHGPPDRPCNEWRRRATQRPPPGPVQRIHPPGRGPGCHGRDRPPTPPREAVFGCAGPGPAGERPLASPTRRGGGAERERGPPPGPRAPSTKRPLDPILGEAATVEGSGKCVGLPQAPCCLERGGGPM